jgi:ABC-2 type transport system permease protein
LSVTTRYWTAADRNTLLPPLSGLLLANRLLWVGVGVALFALAWRIFRFETRAGNVAAKPAEAGVAAATTARVGALPAPQATAATRRTQLLALARFDMAFVFRSPAFFVLLAIGLFNAAFSLLFSFDWYGSDAHPVTRLMVRALQDAFSLIPLIVAIYYAGELVWRDRERRVHEIIDSTAAPDWAHLVPKILAIALVLMATSVVGALAGMGVQLFKGHTAFELAGYALWWVWPMTVSALQLAVLSVLVQVIVPQKFIGWGVMLVYVVAAIVMGSAGFEHNLYNYSGTSPVPLSDMNGAGRFWIGQAWFHAYWSSFALVLAVLAYALWRRGTTTALRPRLVALPRRLRGGALLAGSAGLAVWAGTGAFIFYNTNILNEYQTAPDHDEWLARAEKELLPFETRPTPHITAVTLDVQLYPRETRAVTTGRYKLENRTGQPIEHLHVGWAEQTKIDQLSIDGATLEKAYEEFPHSIYKLQPAMQPGEVREMRFTTTLQERGFPNSGPLTRLVENGSFVDNGQISPHLGVSREGLLTDRAKRRKYGLPADLRPPKLEDESGRSRSIFMVAGDWVDADITVTTDADQTPIAPGYTVSDTTANGRRTARFKTDAPINHFFSIQSGRYEVKRDKAGDVDLAVYYHLGHEYNVDRMLGAMKDSLAMFNEKFSPYQFRQARIIEFPAYADFAQAFANTIPYSENLGFLTKLGDEDEIDVATYVTAHEIGHQWWGHQLVPAYQQGATMLVESFAQYSALLVMEKTYGREQMRKFLKYELDRYLRRRGGEAVEELPLARVENQPYIHYQKGSLAMYWLKEVVGEDKVNRAMARLLQQYAFKSAPYPNTTDFLRLMREEAGPEHDQLITDLFEKITLVDVKAANAKSTKRADGKFEVTFEVEAKKLYADGTGKETEAPLDEPFDIGVFSAEPGKAGYTAASVLSFARQRIRTGQQTVTVLVDQPPAFVGVDPYNKRIDRNSGDNLTKVERD